MSKQLETNSLGFEETTMKQYKLKATAKYHKTHMTGINLRFHNQSDQDVIEKLNSVKNKTDYIRQLIRADIQK